MALTTASEHSVAVNETEWYPSGSRGRPAKALVRFSVARVQIPATPPSVVVEKAEDFSTTFRIFWEFSSVSKKNKKI